jgi:hypothetical protein
MSNTEDASAEAAAAGAFLNTLAEWEGALRAYGRALATYAAEVNDVAQRVLGVRGAASWRLALEATAQRAAQEIGADGTGAPAPASVLADTLEATEARLFSAESVILDPAVHDSAAIGVGRTFSDNLSRLLEAVHRDRRGCDVAHSAVLDAAKVYGRGLARARPEEVLAVTGRWWAPADGVGAEHGGVASAVYTWALARMRSGGGPHAAAAEKMLEAAKNGSLGIPSETPEGILADSRRGRGYHPIQTLGAMPRLANAAQGKSGAAQPTFWAPPGPAEGGPEEPVVDARLPQAKKDVQYDLAALIDPSRAAGDTVRSGLNYRLVERLRSIRETLRDGVAPAQAVDALPDRVSASFLISFGGPQALRASTGRPQLEGDWAPAAGVPPRLAAYSDAIGLLVAARRTEEAAAHLVDKFTAERGSEKDTAGPQTRVSLDILQARIMQKFSATYDAAFGDGPASPAEFLSVAAPPEFVTGLYLEVALFEAGLAHLNRLFDRFWAPGASGARITAEGVRRELAATAAVQAAAAGFELWRRVVGAYQRRAPDSALFAHEPGQRKAALARVHRETIAAALAAPPLEYVQATFKLFRLLGGSAPFTA